jgi:hypothetical protein
MKTIRKIWKGELSLAKTFWVGWVLPNIIVQLLISSNLFNQLLGKSINISLALYTFLAFGTPILFVIYQLFMAVSIWRSANNYEGKKLWCVIAKGILVVFGLIFISISVLGIFALSKVDTNDPGKNSRNIIKFLKQDNEYPYIGFWKNQCNDDFGLSVDKAGNGYYSVSFCGPGGCFKPGTYRPNTKLIGDSAYKVIDNNTIEVQGADGYSTYMRCN